MLNKVYIIAEIGINHEGDVEECRKLIVSAIESGADAVKLQTVNADLNYVPGSESYKTFKGSELTRQETSEMFNFARKNGVDIFTTAGDINTVEWVDKLNPSYWKISSGLLTHIPIVSYIASLGRPLLISTGMANTYDIELAIKSAQSVGNNNISLFQCTSLYPAPFQSLNLSVINWLKDKYGYNVGFSDHSLGDEAAFLSVGAGATLIEKHITFDSNRPGYDHAISLEPDSFKTMVNKIRLAEVMLGSPEKKVSKEVSVVRDNFLRTIVALKSIKKGELFSSNNICVKRAKKGQLSLTPDKYEKIIGRIALNSIQRNNSITTKDVNNIT
jgi:N,N'-diacetyllegionaminate synthase